MQQKKRGISQAGIVGIVFLAVVVGAVVYQTFGLRQVECQVCMSFEGREKCLSVRGESEENAIQTARDNACSFITAGRTEGFRCSQSPPTSIECRPI